MKKILIAWLACLSIVWGSVADAQLLGTRAADSAQGFGAFHKISSGSIIYATWNQTGLGSCATLSGGNLTVAFTTSVCSALSTVSKTSGKWYWELLVNTAAGGPINGIANSSFVTTSWPGGDANSWGYYTSGNKYTNASASAYGATYAVGDYIGIAMDMTGGNVVFYKNCVSQGTAFTGLAGAMFATAGQSGGVAGGYTANFGATSFHCTVPSGYNAGLY